MTKPRTYRQRRIRNRIRRCIRRAAQLTTSIFREETTARALGRDPVLADFIGQRTRLYDRTAALKSELQPARACPGACPIP